MKSHNQGATSLEDEIVALIREAILETVDLEDTFSEHDSYRGGLPATNAPGCRRASRSSFGNAVPSWSISERRFCARSL